MLIRRRFLRASEGAALFFLAALRATAAPNAGPLEPAVFLAAARAGDRVVVVGERGMIRASEDNGVSWRPARVPTDVTLTAVRFADARTGWAVGHEGVILKTTDGGDSWSFVRGAPTPDDPAAPSNRSFYSDRAPLFDFLVLDKDRLWAVGAYGVALHSEDSGITWKSVVIDRGSDFHLFALVRDARGTLWAAGEAGALYASRDSGRTWAAQPKLTPGSFFGAAPLDNGGVILFGLRGRAFARNPVNGTWKPLSGLPPRSLHGAAPAGKDVLLLGGGGGTLVFFDARSHTFQTRRLPVTRDIHCLLPVDDARVLIFCDGETKSYSWDELRGEARP